jgi:hypothetical protein
MNDAKRRQGEVMKVKRARITKDERARRRAEKEEQTIRRLKELVDEPPSRLDRLLKALGHPPTLQQRLKEVGKSVLPVYEKLLRARKEKDAD